MAVDDSSLLPKLPPPRSSGRTSAIDAALRRFDGAEEVSAKPASQRWAWGGRPQWTLAVSASLVAIIGIPAALIAINDQAPPVTQSKQVAKSGAKAPAKLKYEPAAPTEAADEASPPASTAKPEPNRFPVLPDDSAKADDNQAVAPIRSMAAPSPAPPPAPIAEPTEDRAETADAQPIVVTGSRIAAPQFSSRPQQKSAERAYEVAGSPADQAAAVETASARSGKDHTTPEWIFTDPAYRTFFNGLQSAVRSNNRRAVARLINYPIDVKIGGRSQRYRDTASVLRDYDRIFTGRVRQAVLSQQFDQSFGRDLGVMIGRGEIWYDHICRNSRCEPRGPVRITAINP